MGRARAVTFISCVTAALGGENQPEWTKRYRCRPEEERERHQHRGEKVSPRPLSGCRAGWGSRPPRPFLSPSVGLRQPPGFYFLWGERGVCEIK